MDDALLAIALTFGVIGLGLALASTRSAGSSRELARRFEAVAGAVRIDDGGALAFTFAGRPVVATLVNQAWTVTTPVPSPALAYPAAARALGDGPLIAALSAPEVLCEPPRLSLTLDRGRLKARNLRLHLERLTALAAALDGLPLDAALSRHLLDRAPEDGRLSLFETLVSTFPASPETRRCAQALADDPDPSLRDAAARLLFPSPPPPEGPPPARWTPP